MHSKPLNECIDEFRKGLDHGYKNFILDADDIGCYGMDTGSSFTELLNKVTDFEGDYHIDIHYLHPHWVVKHVDAIEKILPKGKVSRILSSIQSGNPRILRLMHRYPDTEKLKEVYMRLKKIDPDLFLETEIICGFPTETMEEFQDTLDFIVDVRFGWGAIFPFSCKVGTVAESIEPKIEDSEIVRRIKYAKKFLRKNNYDVRYVKIFRSLSQGIVVFGDVDAITRMQKKRRSKK